MGNDFTTIVYKPRNTHRPYAVRWRIDGQQHERSFATQAEAEKYKLELDYRRSSGTYIDPAKTEQLFKDAVEDWLRSAPRTIATIRNYRSVLKRYILPEFGDQTITRVAHNLEQIITVATHTGLARVAEKNTRTLGKLDKIITALEQAGPGQIVSGGKVTDLDAAG